MGRGFTAWAAAVVLASAFTGCLGGDDGIPDNVVATGSSPLVMESYDYAGTNVTAGTGAFEIDVTESIGGGLVSGNASAGGVLYDFQFLSFVGDPDSPFQKDGISNDFQEHGASGNGNPLVPEMHLITAGWGPISLTLDGAQLTDPLTGQPSFTGHFMLTDTGIWNDETPQVTKMDGSTPYSPDTPGDGLSYEDDHELHVIIQSDPAATVYDDETTTDSGQLTPQQSTATSTFELATATASFETTVAVQPPAGGLPVVPAEVNVSLQGPSGAVIAQMDLGGQGQANQVTWTVEDPPAEGTYSVVFDSTGAANWSVDTAVDYPVPLFLYIVYEDVTWQDGD